MKKYTSTYIKNYHSILEIKEISLTETYIFNLIISYQNFNLSNEAIVKSLHNKISLSMVEKTITKLTNLGYITKSTTKNRYDDSGKWRNKRFITLTDKTINILNTKPEGVQPEQPTAKTKKQMTEEELKRVQEVSKTLELKKAAPAAPKTKLVQLTPIAKETPAEAIKTVPVVVSEDKVNPYTVFPLVMDNPKLVAAFKRSLMLKIFQLKELTLTELVDIMTKNKSMFKGDANVKVSSEEFNVIINKIKNLTTPLPEPTPKAVAPEPVAEVIAEVIPEPVAVVKVIQISNLQAKKNKQEELDNIWLEELNAMQ